MTELQHAQSCSYCSGDTGAWPKVQPVITCSCCQQPLVALGPSLQRATGRSNLTVLGTASWLVAAMLPFALALHLFGSQRGAEQVVAYVLFCAVGICCWEALANLRSGVSRVFNVVYRRSADALISPVLLFALAGWLMLVAVSIDGQRSDAPGATAARPPQSLSSSRR